MVRTQIQLTEEQADRLRSLSARRGVSLAALIRESVDRTLADDSRAADWSRAHAVLGKYRDREGATDVSSRHDDYLADAVEDWRR
jgi:predicted DNA-binding protein